jgi:hypothetical protein
MDGVFRGEKEKRTLREREEKKKEKKKEERRILPSCSPAACSPPARTSSLHSSHASRPSPSHSDQPNSSSCASAHSNLSTSSTFDAHVLLFLVFDSAEDCC